MEVRWLLTRNGLEPGAANLIRYTNLPPGKYTLYVRAISREEHDIVFEERTMRIVVTHPFWSSWWAITVLRVY